MVKINKTDDYIGKTIDYLDKGGHPHTERVIGVNRKEKVFIVLQKRFVMSTSHDFPTRIPARFVERIY